MGEIAVHGLIGSPFVRSVLVALEEKGQPYRLKPLRLDELRTPGYLALHPFGRVPTFERDGFVLYETQAILRHIDRLFPEPPLTPRGLEAAARMDQALNVVDSYLFTGAGEVLGRNRIIKPRILKQEPDEEACAKAAPRLAGALAALASVLDHDPGLAGGTPSLAEIALACHLDFLQPTPEGGHAIAAEPALAALLARMAERPSMVETANRALARRFMPPKG